MAAEGGGEAFVELARMTLARRLLSRGMNALAALPGQGGRALARAGCGW